MGRDDVKPLPMPSAPSLNVEVVYCPRPGAVDLSHLVLPAGATVGQALLQSGLLARHGVETAALDAGVWGRRCDPSRVLRDGDRVELYRPLMVDPKEARRLRYRKRESRKVASGRG